MREVWNRFLHWQGWKTCGRTCVNGWRAVVQWAAWQKIFGLPLAAALPLLLLTVAMGLYMIRRANREIKTLQETEYGQSFL